MMASAPTVVIKIEVIIDKVAPRLEKLSVLAPRETDA